MSALYRLKAYFGMVPAEELDDHAFLDDRVDPHGEYDRAAHGVHQDAHHDAHDGAHDRDYEPAYERARRTSYGSDWRAGRGSTRWDHSEDGDGVSQDRALGGTVRGGAGRDEDYYDEPGPVRGRRTVASRGWAAEAPVRGALAVDPKRDAGLHARPAPAEEAHPLARITTLHPRTYNEARTIGEHYREGIPVIINLTEMQDADAKRLVDFAAGLAFALRGSIDKVTTKVFLLSPPNVDVTAEDRRRIAEGSFPHRSQ